MSTSHQHQSKQKSKRGRKPLTPLQHWQRNVDNIKTLIKQLETTHQGQGVKWIEGMQKHYDERLALLLAHRPKRKKA